MSQIATKRKFLYVGLFLLLLVGTLLVLPDFVKAKNIKSYKDTLSDSRIGNYSNHTLSFEIETSVSPGGYFDITPDAGFYIMPATTTFSVRNVELLVDGVPRSASSTGSALVDEVTINSGAPGSIRYTLNSTNGIPANSDIKFRIGDNTSNSVEPVTTYSTSTGTTTTPGDVPGIKNHSSVGTHRINLTVNGGAEEAYAGFVIAMTEGVATLHVDTTEEIPPFRFNGLPTGEIGGTTLNVEISLETDELATCKYSTTAGVDYALMAHTFGLTGQIFHSQVVAVAAETLNTFYVRCIDDEDNFNTDDFEISFLSPPPPSGNPNAEGDVEGDGTGTGNDGTGDGDGGGGSTGGTEGESSTTGQESGSGGSGGGGGGGSGGGSGSSGGGGFESSDGPYESGDGRVIISGYAFPNSTVTILVDGNVAKTTKASGNGSYEVTIDEIARGGYTFGIYATDSKGTKSSTFSTSFTVSGARASSLSNINLAPSILVSPNPVDPGQTLTVSGYSFPNATVTLENENSNSSVSRKTFTATAGSSGAWSTTIDTASFSKGTYKIRAKGEQTGGLGIKSNFSNYTFYGVGEAANQPLNPDLNRDGKVNLTDFSILLFWWNSAGGDSDPPADINQDGRVNLTDFSILLFNWTG